MTVTKNAIPLDWIYRDKMYRFNFPLARYIWEKVIDAGHDPTKLVMKFQEIGNGELAIGFFNNEADDFNNPIKGLGFIAPMGFWYTTDDRMPLNWIGVNPPSSYGLPGEGAPVDKSYYEMWKGSGNI